MILQEQQEDKLIVYTANIEYWEDGILDGVEVEVFTNRSKAQQYVNEQFKQIDKSRNTKSEYLSTGEIINKWDDYEYRVSEVIVK